MLLRWLTQAMFTYNQVAPLSELLRDRAAWHLLEQGAVVQTLYLEHFSQLLAKQCHLASGFVACCIFHSVSSARPCQVDLVDQRLQPQASTISLCAGTAPVAPCLSQYRTS